MASQISLPFFTESPSKKDKSPPRVYGHNALILIILCIWGLALFTVGFGLTCVVPDDPSIVPVRLHHAL